MRYLAWALVALGMLVAAVVDERRIGWPVFGGLAVAAGAGGLIVVQVSRFGFAGGDHDLEGVTRRLGSGSGPLGRAAV